MNTALSLAALVVAVASAIVSVLAWRTARHSVTEARRLADIEADRRHDERKPDFVPTIEGVNSGAWYRLVVRLVSDDPVDRIDVRIIDSTSLEFVSRSTDVNSIEDTHTARRLSRLHPHTTEAAWRVRFDNQDRGRTAAIAITAWINDEHWNLTVPAEFPPPLHHAIFA